MADRSPFEKKVWIDYTNYKGERGWREIKPLSIVFTSNTWHNQSQWILHAFDPAKGAIRSFTMKDIHEWRNTPPENNL